MLNLFHGNRINCISTMQGSCDRFLHPVFKFQLYNTAIKLSLDAFKYVTIFIYKQNTYTVVSAYLGEKLIDVFWLRYGYIAEMPVSSVTVSLGEHIKVDFKFRLDRDSYSSFLCNNIQGTCIACMADGYFFIKVP